jgi:hypothetical protein
MKMPVYEVWEFTGDAVKRIAMCGTEADARMMMSLGCGTRSWMKCECQEALYCTEGDK